MTTNTKDDHRPLFVLICFVMLLLGHIVSTIAVVSSVINADNLLIKNIT